jgi:hypothetical protein
MKTVKTLLAYLLFVGFIAVIFTQAGQWLVATDSTIKAEARAAPIPPRIADSIERKKAWTPAPSPAREPLIEALPMQNANAALTKPAKEFVRQLAIAKPRKKASTRSNVNEPALPPREPYARPAVTTARSDTPF